MSDEFGKAMEQWLESQQAFWRTLTEGEQHGDSQSWQQAITDYQQTLMNQWPQQQTELLELLNSQSSAFTQFAEQILKQWPDLSQQDNAERLIQQLQEYMQQQTLSNLMKRWQLPEQLASLFKTHSFSDDLLFENPFISGLKSALDKPFAGANQHQQQNIKESLKIFLEYQEALSEYTRHYSHITQQAAADLSDRLNRGTTEIETLGELHDEWVNSYETAYADEVFTDSYQHAHGRISNALMKAKQFTQQIRDEYFQSVGLATRKGLDTALQRQHELRKEMRISRSQIQQLSEQQKEISNLRLEVDQLRDEMKQLAKAIKQKPAGSGQ